MLDFGFFELLFIIIIAILVIGPKDIPNLMVGFGRIVRRLQYVRFAMSQQFEEFMKENDLEDIRRSVNFETGHIYEDGEEDEAYVQEASIEAPAKEGKDEQ